MLLKIIVILHIYPVPMFTKYRSRDVFAQEALVAYLKYLQYFYSPFSFQQARHAV